LYRIVVNGRAEERVATPVTKELDLRPRAIASSADGGGLGQRHAPVDISGEVALVLLFLTALEMALRVRSALAR
jgi:hypothetical protein